MLTRKELEAYILGVILFDLRYYDSVAHILSKSCFKDPLHQALYEHMHAILKDKDLDEYYKQRTFDVDIINRALIEGDDYKMDVVGVQAISLSKNRQKNLTIAVKALSTDKVREEFGDIINIGTK